MRQEYHELCSRGLASLYPNAIKITVGMSSCGMVAGATKTFEAIGDAIRDLDMPAVLTKTGCIGICEKEPLVYIQVPRKGIYIYGGVTSQKGIELISRLRERSLPNKGLLATMQDYRPLLKETGLGVDRVHDPKEGPELGIRCPSHKKEIEGLPFFSHQRRIATRNCGLIDPLSIEEYMCMGGFEAVSKALSMDPEEVIQRVMLSGLRGRGGAGFPTGAKWHLTRESAAEVKYVICNADEGNPGAYMDRIILESDPFSVIEGMIIGGYAMGARKGLIYLRAEYPLAEYILKRAIGRAKEIGLLGEDILNSGFSYEVEVIKGHGAYVCGEETALISSIEGLMGEPRPRPPFPTQEGLYGRPTCINNVQTWAYVAPIISMGHEWFRAMGTEHSKGTKVFSVVGDVMNTGVVEIPMGTPIGGIVQEICGGTSPFPIKAVEIGGPGGGFVPASLMDLPVSYEHLFEVGAGLGAGLVVLDTRRCMVDMAVHFMEFAVKESCGKCFPCREGTHEMLRILRDISQGRGSPSHLGLLEELSLTLKYSSLCGLGQTAPNPILSALRFFREEFQMHIDQKFCPCGVCKGLFRASINQGDCTSCDKCISVCPSKAIWKMGDGYAVNMDACSGCGDCIQTCPSGAILAIPKEH